MVASSSPLQAILKLLLKWWWLILLSTAVGLGVGAFVRSQQPDIYFATATILFGQNFERGTDTQGFNTSLNRIRDLITIYSGITRRPIILDPVIRDLNLGTSVEELNRVMNVTQAKDLPIMEITIADTRPDRAANIANRIAQEVIAQSPTEQVSAETEFRRQQLRDLQRQIEELKGQYDSKFAAGANLTSAFEIAQNLQERNAILENIRNLQQIYAELANGLPDQSNSLRIFELARPDSVPYTTGSTVSVILSGVAGLALSIITVVLIGYFDKRLQWNESLTTVAGVKVLGPLGVIPRDKLPLYLISMPDAIESEVLRQLRAKLVLAAGGKIPRVIGITSYDSGDGKTITAANLGLSFAQAGLETLIIDGDLRKGDLHEMFRLPNVMGLSDILAGHGSFETLLEQALLDSGFDRLTILPCGRSNADSAALFSSSRFPKLIDALKNRFDVIVMDTVPAIGGPDSAFVAEVSDGMIIVVDSRRTTDKALNRVLQTLHQANNASIFGLAFNRVQLQVTSTHSQPYYRRTLSLSPERLNREVLNAGKRQPLLRFNRHVLMDKNGERLYSLRACAIHLGITEDTVREWIKIGYLNTIRKGRRQWIRESDIELMLNRLPRFRAGHRPLLDDNANADHRPASGASIPDMLRDQRDALLDYVREPLPSAPSAESDPGADE